jgi:hypothetical protein
MRSSCWDLLAAFAVVLAVALPCFGQNSLGPATLENLVNADEAKGTGAIPEAEALAAGPKRPAGTVTRPTGGAQHPDLDKAWAEYDAVVTKAAEGIKAAIAEQFDAATAKGDLDAAEKWQTALEKFDKAGEVPAEKEIKSAVSSAVADYKKAKEELGTAYESVVRALTMEKKIAEAKAAREELQVTTRAGGDLTKRLNLAREGRSSASREKPGNGAVGLAFDGVVRDTDINNTSYWYSGDLTPRPEWLRVDLKGEATITQVRFLVPIGTLRFPNGHEPVDYEVVFVRKGNRRSVCRVKQARHPKVEPLQQKQNVRWIVVDLPKPESAEAVVLEVSRSSGINWGPVIFECEVIGDYLSK